MQANLELWRLVFCRIVFVILGLGEGGVKIDDLTWSGYVNCYQKFGFCRCGKQWHPQLS